jgi:hypothetical protein
MLPASPARSSLRGTLTQGGAGRLFAAYWGSLVLVDLTRPAPFVAATAVAALVAVLAGHQPYVVGLGVAGTGWLFLDGFVSHTGGDLRGTGPADLLLLAVLVVVAALAGALTRGSRR